MLCSAGFQTRAAFALDDHADLEIGDTAGLETCATGDSCLFVSIRGLS